MSFLKLRGRGLLVTPSFADVVKWTNGFSRRTSV